MSKDEFIIHEWQKEKMDALVKHNELEGAKKDGIEENKIEIAKKMLKEKIDKDVISRVTGLTIQEIEKLRSTNYE